MPQESILRTLNFSFLIVEGETDKKLYERYIDTNMCQVTVAGGRDNAREVLSLLEKDTFLGILAIVDADFDVLEGRLPPTQNILFTDTHDLETMIIKSPAFDKVLAEFGSVDKITDFMRKHGKDIRTTLVECGIHIGYLRWVSLRENLFMSFEGLEFNRFISKDELTIDILKLVRAVKERSYNAEIDKSRNMTLKKV